MNRTYTQTQARTMRLALLHTLRVLEARRITDARAEEIMELASSASLKDFDHDTYAYMVERAMQAVDAYQKCVFRKDAEVHLVRMDAMTVSVKAGIKDLDQRFNLRQTEVTA